MVDFNRWKHKLQGPRRYDERGRLLHNRPTASNDTRYLEPVVAPWVATRRLENLESWIEFSQPTE